MFEVKFKIQQPEQEIDASLMSLDLLAKAKPGGDAAGALSVIDTSGCDELHAKYGLPFEKSTSVAIQEAGCAEAVSRCEFAVSEPFC